MAQYWSNKQLQFSLLFFSLSSFKNVEIFHVSCYVYRKFRAGFRVMFITYVQSHLSFLAHRFVGCILDFNTVKSTLF